MTEKKKRFGIEYLKDLNATQAAIRAGYSKDTAYSQGQRLLKDVEVKKYIDSFLDDYLSRSKISIAKVINRLDEIIESDIGDYAEIRHGTTLIDGKPTETQGVFFNNTDGLNTRVLSEMSETTNGIKIKMQDKLKAIDLKGKYLAMWTEKVEQKTVITIENLSDKELDEELAALEP